MEFYFKNGEEEKALNEPNEMIQSYLKAMPQSTFQQNPSYPERMCDGSFHVTADLEREYDRQRQNLPFTAKDMQEFIDNGLNNFEQGFFSVLWFGKKQPRDIIFKDDFRSVITFRTFQLMVRPLDDNPDGNGPPRIYLGPGDLKDCLDAALNAALSRNANEPTKAVVGRGSVMDPADVRYARGNPDKQERSRIPFEWKVDRADDRKLDIQVQKWRTDACNGFEEFETRRQEYLHYLATQSLTDPSAAARWSFVLRLGTAKQAERVPGRMSKRSSGEMDASQAFNPTSKRRSLASQASSGSQSGSAPPSQTSSPEIPRPPSAMSANMGPPRFWGPGQTRGSRGSRGSLGSDTSVTSTMAGLSFQSPVLHSPGDMPPPPEGSSWGGPQGMTGWTSTAFGRGYTPRHPIPGYQGPGQAQPPAAYAPPTDVYGYPSHEFQGPSQRPLGLGIQNTQQNPQYGARNPPPPAQPRVSAEQAAARLSHQHARVGLVPSQTGSGYPSNLAPNVPLQGPGPNMPYGMNFPPVQSDMHGGGTHLPQQPIPAGTIHRSEDEILSADSGLHSEPESDGDSEPESDGDSELESDGEDDQPAHQDAPVSQALQHPGGQGNYSFYESPSPIGGHQRAHRDPFWGGGDSEGSDSGDD